MKTEKNKQISFVEINDVCKQGKSATNIYRKQTFSGVYNNFDSILPKA